MLHIARFLYASMCIVGQNHICIYTVGIYYGVVLAIYILSGTPESYIYIYIRCIYMVFLPIKLPKTQCIYIYIYGSGQPYVTCIHMHTGSCTVKHKAACSYLYCWMKLHDLQDEAA